MNLPALPIPVLQSSELVESASGVLGALYLKEQMKSYGQECRLAALEECTELLKKIEEGYGVTDKGLSENEYQRMKQTAREHQEAIRRLK